MSLCNSRRPNNSSISITSSVKNCHYLIPEDYITAIQPIRLLWRKCQAWGLHRYGPSLKVACFIGRFAMVCQCSKDKSPKGVNDNICYMEDSNIF